MPNVPIHISKSDNVFLKAINVNLKKVKHTLTQQNI